jgi:uncharacterized membrane protein
MAVLAAAGFAAVTLVGSRPVPGLDDLTVTGFGFTIGGLALVPLAQIAGGIDFRPGLAAIGLLIALGIGPTAVAYTLYFRGLRSAAASTAALLTLLEPLTGTILAAVLLGERLSASGISGAAVIAAAVLLTVRANRDRPDARPVISCATAWFPVTGGRIRRDGATRSRPRCDRVARGRATGTCPTGRLARARTPSRCGRRRRPRARTR